jgi:hypothetical protein
LVLSLAALVVAPMTAAGAQQVLLPVRDSAAIAFETGRRDALVLHPTRRPMLPLLAAPAGLALSVTTHELWVLPATQLATTWGTVAYTYRQSKRPAPAPPDSMRRRYGQLSPGQWDAYERGFRTAIDRRRDEMLAEALRLGLYSSALSGALLVFLRQHSGR